MAAKHSGKNQQATPQAIWERTKGVATQIIEDDHQLRTEKIAKLKAARLAKEAAAPTAPKARRRAKNQKT